MWSHLSTRLLNSGDVSATEAALGVGKNGVIPNLYHVNKQGEQSAYRILSSLLKRERGTKGKEQRPFARTQEKPIVP